MTNTQFGTLVLAVRDSVRAGTTSLMDAQDALEALCESTYRDYDYWFEWMMKR